MNISTNNTTTTRPAKRTRMRAVVLSIAMLLGTQNAYAGMPVIDITSILGEVRSWISDTTEYAKEAVRWNEWKQQIDSIRDIFNALNFAIGLPAGEKLEKVDPKYLVQETCGGDAMGFNMTTAMSVLGIDLNSDIKKQQQQICVNIQMMQNRKFNDSVEFLDKTIKQAQDAAIEVLLARNNSKNSVGGVSATTSDATRLNNELNMLAQQWGTRMQSYDAYIATMERRQNLLAKTALKGKQNKLAADLVQTIALKAALSID